MEPLETTCRVAQEAFTAAERGDGRAADAWLACSSEPGSEAALWRQALATMQALNAPAPTDTLEQQALDVPARLTPVNPDALAQLCRARAMLAFCTFDAAALRMLRERCLGPLTTASHPATAALTGWCALFDGEVAEPRLAARLEEARAQAASAQMASLAIELSVLRALVAMEAGDLLTGRRWARRAARMARTEALPHGRLLAGLALARCRRFDGQLHLATRILTTLAEQAPAAWRPWLVWESLLCGEPPPPRPSSTDVTSPPYILAAVLRHALAPEAGACTQALVHLRERVSDLALLSREVETLATALSADARVAHGPLAPWTRGETEIPPPALRGLLQLWSQHESEGRGAAVYAVAQPEAPPRRLLGVALRMHHPGLLSRPPRRQDRLDSAAATLALAGEKGLDDATFFRTVYGFAFVPALHDGILRVLVHRLRQDLEPDADIERRAQRLVMLVQRPLALPDPRGRLRLEDTLLKVLAGLREGVTANQAAGQLGVSLRTVQTTLRELVADGLCRATREGRQLRYRVEDTTFSDTTSKAWGQPSD